MDEFKDAVEKLNQSRDLGEGDGGEGVGGRVGCLNGGGDENGDAQGGGYGGEIENEVCSREKIDETLPFRRPLDFHARLACTGSRVGARGLL